MQANKDGIPKGYTRGKPLNKRGFFPINNYKTCSNCGLRTTKNDTFECKQVSRHTPTIKHHNKSLTYNKHKKPNHVEHLRRLANKNKTWIQDLINL